MYFILLSIFIIKLQISVSDPQFPAHVDLQKVGEAIFNNEKFNILKTATHVITDHFKEFMLRSGSESLNHPAKKVFLDENGFRHEWSGFGEETKSLRKTDLKYLRGSFEAVSEDIAANGTINTTDTGKDSSENNEDEENNASDSKKSVQNFTEKDNETDSKDTASTNSSVSATHVKDSSYEITIEERLRTGKKDDKKTDTAKTGEKKGDDKNKKNVPKAEEKKGDDKNKKDTPKAEEKKGDDKNKKDTPKVEEKKGDDKNKKDTLKVEEKKGDDKNKKDTPKVEEKKVDDKSKKDTPKVEEKKVEDKKNTPKDEEKKSDGKNKEKATNEGKVATQEEKTVMQATFFCPYLGIITMSRFIDL